MHTMKAKSVACNTTTTRAIWVKQFIENLKLIKWAMKLFCDNKTTILSIKNGRSSKGKQLDVSYHYEREKK